MNTKSSPRAWRTPSLRAVAGPRLRRAQHEIGVAPGDLGGPVGAAVVHHDQLPGLGGEVAGAERGKRLREVRGAVAHRHDHREPRMVSAVGGLSVAAELSIVVPTYRRPHQLADCLRSLAALDYPRDRFEVIVVDDGGETPLDTDGRAVSARDFASPWYGSENAGPAAARNTGAEHATGEYHRLHRRRLPASERAGSPSWRGCSARIPRAWSAATP